VGISPNCQYMALYLSQLIGTGGGGGWTVTFLEEGLDDLRAALLCCVEEGRAFDVVLGVEVNIIPA
jgi:hypothetical protein